MAAQLFAGILFLFGGIGGITNASYNINLVIHNTVWIPGHLHLTVGTAVTLSFMGITYWLLPHITGRKLWGRKVALWPGVDVVHRHDHLLQRDARPGSARRAAAHAAGPGALRPRRNGTARQIQTGVGGAILLVSAILYFVVVLKTVLAKRAGRPRYRRSRWPSRCSDPQLTPAWLDRWAPWLVATIVLIIIAYGPQLIAQIGGMQLTSPGMRVW